MVAVHRVIRKWRARIGFGIHAAGGAVDHYMIVANELWRHLIIRDGICLGRPAHKQGL